MSAPAPGSTPMMMPTMLPRVICQWYILVSIHWPAMMLPNLRRGSGGGSGVSIARITWATANTPTSAGIGSMPPNRSVMPKVKRGTPPGFSMPTQETSRPRNMPAIAFTGEERATSVAHIRPSKRQPEILEGRERQRDLGERRRQDHQRQRAGDAADGREPDAGAERELGLALAGHGVGFVGIGRGGRRAGDAQQRAGDVAGEDRHRGRRHDGRDRRDRREIEGDGHQQRGRHRGGEARQRADDEAVHRGGQHRDDDFPGGDERERFDQGLEHRVTRASAAGRRAAARAAACAKIRWMRDRRQRRRAAAPASASRRARSTSTKTTIARR